MQAAFDAIIVGAGPAGSAAAIVLARAGWSVALLEKRPFPRRKVCGECLAASNLSILDELGVGEAFRDRAGPELRRLALLRGDSRVLAELPSGEAPGRRWGRALGRETLDTLLRDRAVEVGVTVLQPWAVQALRGTAGDWQVEARAVESGRSLCLRAPVAIAAHGSWESLPSRAGRRASRRRAGDLLGFKAQFRGTAQAAGVLTIFALHGAYGGMVLGDGGVTTVACCVRRDRLEACRRARPGLRAGEAVEAWLGQACRGVRETLAAHREGPWLAAGPLDPGIRLRADDAMLRIGNAAGEAHPIVGEGMSMALQSAWLLGHRLARIDRAELGAGGAARQREVAAEYAAAWRRQFATRLRLAAAFAHACMRPAGSALLVGAARTWPGLLTQGAIWCGKTRDISRQELRDEDSSS
ncbi:MAG: FAD-dependent monooxygenase [Betaproteobacteria bacterium]|nr:FAD-dependent monooxygenase [Betaproteobacteria bacterium]